MADSGIPNSAPVAHRSSARARRIIAVWTTGATVTGFIAGFFAGSAIDRNTIGTGVLASPILGGLLLGTLGYSLGCRRVVSLGLRPASEEHGSRSAPGESKQQTESETGA
ncbi:MAG: hypothetical protein J0L61_08020 [Planctomycetes bacterium]|nr:hypothetical protein [Planctomycetota bacterium]